MDYKPLVRRTDSSPTSYSLQTLDARLNYVFRLYDASREESTIEPQLQIGFRENIDKLGAEGRAELLRYIKFKARNYEIARNRRETERYSKVVEYFIMNFL